MVDFVVALQTVAATAASPVQNATNAVQFARDTNTLGTTAIVSAASAYVIQMLKNAKWFPVISDKTTKWGQIAFSALVALCTSLGVHYSYDATAGQLVITGLLASSLYDHAVDWLRTFILQQLTYDVAINRERPPAITEVGATK